jgi:ABC-type nitrate/sulfonate/bicarbonate transport system substrate-binding protein
MIQTTRRRFMTGACAVPAALASGPLFAQGPLSTTIANASGNTNLTIHQMLADLSVFAKYGLKANVMSVADGSKIVGGLIGGEIDSSMMSGFGQVFPAIEKGAKLRIIGGAQMRPALALFTSKDNVRSLKDLEGKTVGTGAIGSLLHQMCVAVLLKNKLDVGKVRFVNIGSSGDVFRATRMGTIDAGLGETAIVDEIDIYPGLHLVEGGNLSTDLTEYTYQGAWTSDRVIQSKRDVLVRSLAAQADFYGFLHKPEAKDAFMKARAKVLPSTTERESLAQWSYLQKYKPFSTDLTLSEERVNFMQQLNVETKVQSAVMPMDKVADMTIARDALALVEKTGRL